ncbi:DUF1684 domain-containing protein [Acidisphaera sp. L21]|uniref:DUF1684 domain-containing protein n=1 Tax=Acidisphaera sp. L21 TaxID=1641851 RepID=UPI00131D98F9|nr:DUF1684 domain-containing protein [Acidisphaera sp. L21]
MPDPSDAGPYGELWDWRRRVAALYTAIRNDPNPPRAWDAWCHERNELFRNHPQSALDPPQRAEFTRLRYFPYDSALRFAVDLRPIERPAFTVDVGGDGAIHLQAFAQTIGLSQALGRELTLYWVGGYGGGVFLPFTDATCGSGSYGGGRYLLDTIKGADLGTTPDGRTILDFNFAYNPSCSYSPRYVCPLSPADNRLPAAVRAGEKLAG